MQLEWHATLLILVDRTLRRRETDGHGGVLPNDLAPTRVANRSSRHQTAVVLPFLSKSASNRGVGEISVAMSESELIVPLSRPPATLRVEPQYYPSSTRAPMRLCAAGSHLLEIF